jgi:hypothetical protein
VLQPVAGTPFDLRAPVTIGARIHEADAQLTIAGGFDHNFVINRTAPALVHAARVVEPTSGRTLDVETTEPGIQFYTGNFLDGSITGKRGHVYGRRNGFCLETQHFPDSPNQPAFPSTILRPGEEYRSRTVYTFGVVTPKDRGACARGSHRRGRYRLGGTIAVPYLSPRSKYSPGIARLRRREFELEPVRPVGSSNDTSA